MHLSIQFYPANPSNVLFFWRTQDVVPTIKAAVTESPWRLWWVGLLYAVQNLLYFVCLQYTSAAAYQVLSAMADACFFLKRIPQEKQITPGYPSLVGCIQPSVILLGHDSYLLPVLYNQYNHIPPWLRKQKKGVEHGLFFQKVDRHEVFWYTCLFLTGCRCAFDYLYMARHVYIYSYICVYFIYLCKHIISFVSMCRIFLENPMICVIDVWCVCVSRLPSIMVLFRSACSFTTLQTCRYFNMFQHTGVNILINPW